MTSRCSDLAHVAFRVATITLEEEHRLPGLVEPSIPFLRFAAVYGLERRQRCAVADLSRRPQCQADRVVGGVNFVVSLLCPYYSFRQVSAVGDGNACANSSISTRGSRWVAAMVRHWLTAARTRW